MHRYNGEISLSKEIALNGIPSGEHKYTINALKLVDTFISQDTRLSLDLAKLYRHPALAFPIQLKAFSDAMVIKKIDGQWRWSGLFRSSMNWQGCLCICWASSHFLHQLPRSDRHLVSIFMLPSILLKNVWLHLQNRIEDRNLQKSDMLWSFSDGRQILYQFTSRPLIYYIIQTTDTTSPNRFYPRLRTNNRGNSTWQTNRLNTQFCKIMDSSL